MLAHIDTQLTTLVDNYLQQHHTQPHDRVGIILEIDGDDRRYGRTTHLSENPLAVLFDYIRALLQSNEVLALKTWVMIVDIFRNPRGRSASEEIRSRSETIVSAESARSRRSRDGSSHV